MKLSDLQRLLDQARTSLPDAQDPEIRLRIGPSWADDAVVTVREVFAAPVGAGRPSPDRLPPMAFSPSPPEPGMGVPPSPAIPGLPPLYIQPKMLEIEGK